MYRPLTPAKPINVHTQMFSRPLKCGFFSSAFCFNDVPNFIVVFCFNVKYTNRVIEAFKFSIDYKSIKHHFLNSIYPLNQKWKISNCYYWLSVGWLVRFFSCCCCCSQNIFHFFSNAWAMFSFLAQRHNSYSQPINIDRCTWSMNMINFKTYNQTRMRVLSYGVRGIEISNWLKYDPFSIWNDNTELMGTLIQKKAGYFYVVHHNACVLNWTSLIKWKLMTSLNELVLVIARTSIIFRFVLYAHHWI